MSIWTELLETEKIVSEASKPQPFVAQRRSNIRERAISKMALAAARPAWKVQGASELAEPGLSPELRAIQAQSLGLRQGARERYRQQLIQIRKQDALADADAIAFARLSPLQQAKRRDGWYRVSDLDRQAAIAGLLRRERRTSSPLTREAASRAKSIDAARRREPYVVTDADLAKPVDNSDLLDPCIEYALKEKRRRETMFARGEVIRGGYPGRRGASVSPC